MISRNFGLFYSFETFIKKHGWRVNAFYYLREPPWLLLSITSYRSVRLNLIDRLSGRDPIRIFSILTEKNYFTVDPEWKEEIAIPGLFLDLQQLPV